MCACSSQQAEDTTTAAAAPVTAVTAVTPAHVKSSDTVAADKVKLVNPTSSTVSAELQYLPKQQSIVSTSGSSNSSSWNSSGSGYTAVVQPIGSQIAPAVQAVVRDSAKQSSSSAAAVSMQNTTAGAGSDRVSQQQASGTQQQQQQSKQPLWLQRPRSNMPTRVQ
jgi:hypothetical protein